MPDTPTREPLEQRVAAVIGDNHSAAYMCDPKLAAEVIALVREQCAAAVAALHIPGAPGVGDETYNSAVADAVRLLKGDS